jgi:hypothetical protein
VLQLDPSDDEADYGVNFCDQSSFELCNKCQANKHKIKTKNSSCASTEEGDNYNDDENDGGDGSYRSGSGEDIGCQLAVLLRDNVRVVRMDASQARGPCWARHVGQSLW